jgi:hypothetical protein
LKVSPPLIAEGPPTRRLLTEAEWLRTPLKDLEWKGNHKPSIEQGVIWPLRLVVWEGIAEKIQEIVVAADNTIPRYEPYKECYSRVSNEVGVAGYIAVELTIYLTKDLAGRGPLRLEWVLEPGHVEAEKGEEQEGDGVPAGTGAEEDAELEGGTADLAAEPNMATADGGGEAASESREAGSGDALHQRQAGLARGGSLSEMHLGLRRLGRRLQEPDRYTERQLEERSLEEQGSRRTSDFNLEGGEGGAQVTAAFWEVKCRGVLPANRRRGDDHCPLVDAYEAGARDVGHSVAQGFGYAVFKGCRHIIYSDWEVTYVARRLLAEPQSLEVAGPFFRDRAVAAIAYVQREAAAEAHNLPLEIPAGAFGTQPFDCLDEEEEG